MMTREQFDKASRALLKREPFQPFVIECDDGRRFVVGHPKALMQLAGSAVFFWPDGEFDFLESESVRQLIELKESTPA